MRHFNLWILVCVIATVLALGSLPVVSEAQGFTDGTTDCDGDGEFAICLPCCVELNETFHIGIKAPKGHIVVLFVSPDEGPTNTPFGELCIDLGSAGRSVFQMTNDSVVCFPHDTPGSTSLIGRHGYWQFIAIDPVTLEFGISNMKSFEVKGEGGCHGGHGSSSSDDDSSSGDGSSCGSCGSCDDGSSGDGSSGSDDGSSGSDDGSSGSDDGSSGSDDGSSSGGGSVFDGCPCQGGGSSGSDDGSSDDGSSGSDDDSSSD